MEVQDLIVCPAATFTVRLAQGKNVYAWGANGGHFYNGTQVLGSRVTGFTAMTGSPDKATSYATGSVTTAQLAGRVAALQAALTAHGIIGA
jgi:hypothetical protein